MIKEENLKIVGLSFALCAFLAGFAVKVVFELLAASFGLFAGFYSMDVFRHGIPLGAGLLSFAALQLRPASRQLADEVVTEVRKVVWPSKKELYSMTSVVCLILLVSGAVLGVFDMTAGTVITFFLNLR